ncbi:MAG: YbdK family carboxylate-amine ligase [Legionella sp.]|nr:YbdK family carboxylate-amine ligase [Legionella sp.]
MTENPSNTLHFQTNGVLTLGVEIELQLVDPVHYTLLSRAEEILYSVRDCPKIKPEFYLSTIEINTGICQSVQDVATDLSATIDTLIDKTQSLNIAFASTGSHPFARYADWTISPTPRYQALIDRNQYLTRRMSVYGLHIHIGMENGDDCIRFNNFFMYFLPHLLALSSSSPFWQGIDTGLASCRPTTYESLPTAGHPYHVRNWQEFEQLYKSLVACHSIESIRDLWWDLRPSPGFGTLEIRVCDGAATLKEALAIVAFVHALGHWFKDNGSWLENVAYPPYWLSRENKWRAIRYGLDAELVINTDGKIKTLREDLREWLSKLEPYVAQLNYKPYFEELTSLLQSGTSAERQRAVFHKTQSLQAVVQHNVKEFFSQAPHRL